MTYTWEFGTLWQYRWVLATGLGWTVVYAIGTTVTATGVGIAVATLRLLNWRVLNLPLGAVVAMFRCTPILVQVIWFYYALPVLIGINIPPEAAAAIVLTLYGGAFYSEIVRGGIAAVGIGQWDAARALGLRGTTLLRRVVLPQAGRVMLPPYVNQTILQLKNTSLISVIAVPDLIYQATQVTSATYRPLEVYTLVAACYFAILFPLTVLARVVERRLVSNR